MRTLLILGRISNLPTAWTNVLVGWFLCGGGWTPELGWLALGVSFLYIGGMTLNDAFDADWDREHATERPIPSGKISRKAVWAVGIIEMLAGIGTLLALTTMHPIVLVALVQAILLYNLLHKQWKGSVLIMGLCRALVYIGAGSAVVSQTKALDVSYLVYAISAIVIIYIAGLTLAARSEHLREKLKLSFLHRLMLMLPVLMPLVASRSVPTDAKQMIFAAIGVLAVWAWITLMRGALLKVVPKGIAYAIAGIALYDATAVAFADWRAALACFALFGMTLAAQRVIPAT